MAKFNYCEILSECMVILLFWVIYVIKIEQVR
jgi:hypothetical protein